MDKIRDNVFNFIINNKIIYYMSTHIYILILLALIISAIVFVFIYISNNNYHTKIFVNIQANMEEKLKKNNNYFSYDKINERLSKYGAYYRMGKIINPAIYIILNILIALSLFIGVLILTKNIIVSAFLGIIGFEIFDFIIKYQNKSDNKKMVEDITLIFNTIKIQTRAGSPIQYVLADCFKIAKNPRLKSELLKYVNEINITNNVIDATDKFQNQFDNEYIDTMCVAIQQGYINGFSLKILEDLIKQMNQLQEIINYEEEEKLNFQVEIAEIFIMVGAISALLYGIISDLPALFSTFN